MKLKPLFIFAIICSIHHHVISQNYSTAYDVLKERLELSDSTFKFIFISPLDADIIIEGNYIRSGDTLIFNPDIQQNTHQILNCNCSFFSTETGYFLKIIDEQGKSLTDIDIINAGEYLESNKNGLIKFDEGFPSKILLSYQGLSQRVWGTPYEYTYLPLSLNCETKTGNLMIIQLDLSQEYKTPYEYKTKLLKQNDSLFYIHHSGEIMNLRFVLDSTAYKPKTQKEIKDPSSFFKETEISDIATYFDPKLADQFVQAYINQDIDFLYQNSDEQVQKRQTKEVMEQIFGLINQVYGKPTSYSFEKATTTPSVFNNFQIINCIYKINFSSFQGKLFFRFNVINHNTINMLTVRVIPDEFSQIEYIQNLASPVLKAIQKNDNKKLYKLTSNRFKQYTDLSSFEEFTNELFKYNLDNIRLKQTSINVQNGLDIVTGIYELSNEDLMLHLAFTKFDGTFQLERINYIPISKQ